MPCPPLLDVPWPSLVVTAAMAGTLVTAMVSTCRYHVTGFIDKNKDPIYQDFKRLLYNR